MVREDVVSAYNLSELPPSDVEWKWSIGDGTYLELKDVEGRSRSVIVDGLALADWTPGN